MDDEPNDDISDQDKTKSTTVTRKTVVVVSIGGCAP